VLDEVSSTSLLRVGANVGVEASLIVEDGQSLEGQIIINANGSTSSFDLAILLAGDVNVEGGDGPQYITVPDYGYVRSDLGGGAVGLVPFRLHLGDSSPPSDPDPSCATFETKAWPSTHGGGTRETIVLQFYGPVYDYADDRGDPDDEETKPVKVGIQSLALVTPPATPPDDEESLRTDRTDLFDVYVPGNGSSTFSREVWVARKLDGSSAVGLGGHRYWITPALDTTSDRWLRCDKTFAGTTNPPEVAEFAYELDPYCESFSPSPGE
jgi:hypothetical protein